MKKSFFAALALAAFAFACTPQETEVKPAGIELDRDNLTMEIAQKTTLTATVVPENASNKSIDWASSNPSVATVSDDGEVTAVAAGEADITASSTLFPDIKASCHVVVEEVKVVTEITLDKTSVELDLGGSVRLQASVSPDDAADKTVSWSSDNESVAKVSSTGLVEAVGAGDATITAAAGTASVTCKVTVLSYTDTGLGIKVDGCNTPSGWCYGKNVDNEGKPFDFTADDMDKEDYLTGCASLKVSPKHYRFFQKTFEEPVDVSGIKQADACLIVSLYVNNASLIPHDVNGQIEISSSGKADDCELAWTFGQFTLKDGWNTLMLPFACAAKTGEFNPAGLNFVRIYHTGADLTGALTLKLDQVRVASCSIQCFDELKDYGMHPQGVVSLDTEDKQEGVGCFFYSSPITGNIVLVNKEIWKWNPAFWMTPVSDKRKGFAPSEGKVVQFKLWIEDVELFNACDDGEIEFCTGDREDTEETSWNFRQWGELHNGWNTVVLPISTARKNDADLANIRYFRFYRVIPDKDQVVCKFKLDDLIIYPEGLCPRN